MWFVLLYISVLKRDHVAVSMWPKAKDSFLQHETRSDRKVVSHCLPSGQRQVVYVGENMEGLIWLLCLPGGREIVDHWLKSKYPSVDTHRRCLASLPWADLIKRIVPVSRLHFIFLLILMFPHKLSTCSIFSLFITVNCTFSTALEPVSISSEGSTNDL